MSSRIPDETLSKVLEKIQLQVYQTNQQLSALRAQIAAREREAKLNTLTLTELQAIQDPNAPFYRSVGKMYVHHSRLPIQMPPELTLTSALLVLLGSCKNHNPSCCPNLSRNRPPSHQILKPSRRSKRYVPPPLFDLTPIKSGSHNVLAHTVPPKTTRRRTGPPQRHLFQRQPSAATRSLTLPAPSPPCIHTDIQNKSPPTDPSDDIVRSASILSTNTVGCDTRIRNYHAADSSQKQRARAEHLRPLGHREARCRQEWRASHAERLPARHAQHAVRP